MTKHLLICLALLSLPCAISEAQPDRADHWRADLDLLATELPQKHIDLFHTLPEAEFRQGIDSLKQSADALDDNQLTLQLMELVARVGDGHTSVQPDVGKMRFLPLQFYLFKDGLYVIQASPEWRDAFGGRVTRIGSLPIDDVLQQVSRYAARDNQQQLKNSAPRFLRVADMLVAAGAWKDVDSGTIEYQKNGESKTVTCRSMSADQLNQVDWVSRKVIPMYQQKSELDHWNDWLPDSKTVFFKYNRCRNKPAFDRLVRGTSGFIAQNDVQKFVLDLRDNGGGDSRILSPLLTYLASSPKLNKPDRLFVIIGRTTFSSAVLNASETKLATQATFVGEPSGGKPNHYGEVRSLVLPNSGLTVRYCTNKFQRIEGSDPPSLMPDINIEPTFADWSNGRDPVLEAILKRR
ncbi:MAG: hypothetical protein MK108_07340 [Mariniblastus sp.]|nr:hypothetical protein [Mariniblastus sp.]